MIDQFYISATKPAPLKTLVEVVNEICLKEEPKPIFCEIPDDLKIRQASSTGTASNSVSSSMATISSPGTTTTTI